MTTPSPLVSTIPEKAASDRAWLETRHPLKYRRPVQTTDPRPTPLHQNHPNESGFVHSLKYIRIGWTILYSLDSISTAQGRLACSKHNRASSISSAIPTDGDTSIAPRTPTQVHLRPSFIVRPNAALLCDEFFIILLLEGFIFFGNTTLHPL